MKAIRIKLARAKEIARRGGPTFKPISGGKFRCNQAPEFGRLTMTNVEAVRGLVSELTAIKPKPKVEQLSMQDRILHEIEKYQPLRKRAGGTGYNPFPDNWGWD